MTDLFRDVLAAVLGPFSGLLAAITYGLYDLAHAVVRSGR